LDEIQRITQLYRKASGAKINKSKSEIILFQLGSENLFDLKDYTLKEFTKYLGVYIGHNIPPTLLWDLIIKKMKISIAIWNRRKLSIQGRILVAKIYILSRVWFAATNQIIPKKVLDEIHKIIYEYIWEGKRAPVNHAIASLDKKDGGINVLDLEFQIQALLSKWIVQLLSPTPKKWKAIVMSFLEESTTKSHLGMNVFKTDIYLPSLKISPFWNEVLKVWKHLGISRIFPPQKRIDFLNEPLHRNLLIRSTSDQVIKKKTLLNNGFYTVKDLMIGDQFPKKEDLHLLSTKKRVQKEIEQTISILNKEWIEKIQSYNPDTDNESRLLNLLSNLNHVDQPRTTRTPAPTPLIFQFGFIDKQQNKITLARMTVKQAYKQLISRNPTPLLKKHESQWEMVWEIDSESNQLLWEKAWPNCYNLPIYNKKKELPWRILHNAIFTKSRLALFKPEEISPLCSFCNGENETIRHLWVSCPNAKAIWSWVNRLINHDITRER
jgi:hypothetical protein